MVTVDEPLIVDLAQAMVRTETANPPANERRLAEMLAARARSLGLEAEVRPLEADRANLLLRLGGTGERPPLVLTGHLDTVPPGPEPWSRPPFGGDLADGRLHGRGACDMKGGVAAAAALARARPGGLRGDLILALTAGEEVDSCGAQALVRGGDIPTPAGLLVAEPTNLGLYTAERGLLWVEVLFRGKAAHGSSPHLGVNAILAATDLLRRLEALS